MLCPKRRPRRGVVLAVAETLERRVLLTAVSWTGAADHSNWATAGNWSTGSVPTAGDDLTIFTADTIHSDDPRAVHDLSLQAGTITGSGELDIGGTFDWQGGTLAGSGKTVVAASGQLRLSVNGRTLSRELDVNGPTSWTGGGITFSDGTFENRGTFTAAPLVGQTLSLIGGPGTNAFDNDGSFVLSAADPTGGVVDTTSFADLPFNNRGTGLQVQQGTMTFASGGTSAAPMTAAAQGAIAFGNDYSFQAGNSLTGDGAFTFTRGTQSFPAGQFHPTGTVNFTGGTVTVADTFTPTALGGIGADVTLNADQVFPALDLTSGTIEGSGNVTVTGILDWNAGTMSGTGKTVVPSAGSLRLSGPNSHALNRELDVSGPTSWSGGAINFSGGTFENNGAFTATPPAGASLVLLGGTGTNAFNNNGDFVLNPGDATGIVQAVAEFTAMRFNNRGHVTLTQGTLRLASGGSHSGDFTGQPGTTLELAGGHTFSTSSHVTGALDVLNSRDDTVYPNDLATTGTLSASGGTITIGGATTVSGISLTGGTLRLGASLRVVHGGSTPPPVRTYLASGALKSTGTAALGYAEGADGVVNGLSPGTLLVQAALPGDANLDGKVNFSDLLLLAQHYALSNANWDQGDFNYDGQVQFPDLLLLAQNYGSTALIPSGRDRPHSPQVPPRFR